MHRPLILFLMSQLFFFNASTVAAQLGCYVNVPGLHWCDTPITISYEGGDWVNPFNGGLVMQSAVSTAVGQINDLEALGLPIHLSIVAAGTGNIKVYFAPIAPHPESGDTVLGLWQPTLIADDGSFVNGTLTFNSSIFTLSTSFSRETTALHELLHAVGLGGADTSCANDSVMLESIQPGDLRNSINSETIEALECVYGNLTVSQCGALSGLSVRANPRSPNGVTVRRGTCDGCGPTCSAPSPTSLSVSPSTSFASPANSPSASSSAPGSSVTRSSPAVGEITYEIALSELGGPFLTVATLTEADWTNDTYDYVPTQDYAEATLRLRRLENGVVTGQSETWDPIQIAGGPPVTIPALSGLATAVLALGLLLLGVGVGRAYLRRT